MRIFRLGGLLSRFGRRGAVKSGKVDPSSSARSGGVASPSSAGGHVAPYDLAPLSRTHGVDGITHATDAWFAAELAELERHAREEAAAWATAGIPRLDVADEALEIEVAIEKRCAELFRRWGDRVRTRLEDAVHDALRAAAHGLVALRIALSGLRRALAETATTESALGRLRAEEREPEIVYGFPRFLPRVGFWSLIALLVGVDLVANIPVFHELLPHESGEELLWQELAARAERFGIWSGAYRVAARLLLAPDITLLAFGVIAFLVFSAHVFGEALRRHFALREEDLPGARHGIRAHRRQWLFPAAASLLAAGIVISFLFISRGRIENAAYLRHREAAAQVASLERSLADARAAGDLDAIGAAEARLPGARAVLADRERKVEYASGISAMNLPILLLNLVLALAAALASYLVKQDRIVDGHAIGPRQHALHERLATLHTRAAEERSAIHRASEDVVTSLHRARRLLQARPLSGWEAKAERLRGVVPVFRAENARLRGIDPGNIAAFRRAPSLELTPAAPDALLPAPAELARHEAELERLHAELTSLDEPALAADMEDRAPTESGPAAEDRPPAADAGA